MASSGAPDEAWLHRGLAKGIEPDFGLGSRIDDAYQGDEEVSPNSRLASLE